MGWTKNVSLLAAVGALAAVGCSEDKKTAVNTDAGPGGSTDTGGNTPDAGGGGGDCTGGTDRVYVFNVLAPGYANTDGELPGYNLDNRVSADDDAMACFKPDGTSPEGVEGIDNIIGQNETLIEGAGGLTASFAENIAQGDLLLIVRLHNVDDVTNDDCVNMDIGLGVLPEGVDAPELGKDGLLVAGQTFDMNEVSFEDDGVTPLVQLPRLAIEDGHIHGGPVDVDITLPLMGNPVSVTLGDSYIDFDVSANALTNGVLGGSLGVQTAAAAFVVALGGSEETYLTLLGGLADLGYMDVKGEPVCNALSMALTFSGVGAVDSGEVVAGRDLGGD